MKPLVQSVRIDAPAEAVWRTVTDIGRCHEIIPSIRRIEMLGDAPCGLGARWRETRIMFGREATEVLEITEWRPPTEYVVGATSHGCEYRTVVRVRPDGAGCVLEYEFASKPLTIMARIMGALMIPLMKGTLCKARMEDLHAIKSHCERSA